jgi:hypothetical protein
MDIHQFLSASSGAVRLLAANPWHWLGIVLIFLIGVEALMFIPYVGFVLKLAVAGIVGAKILEMFASSSTGAKPNLTDLLTSFALPVETQVLLAFAAIIPFAIGMVFLYLKAGPSAIEFFFSNIFRVKPPPKEIFVQLKYVMLVASLPLTFLAGAVVLKGLSGFAAVTAALSAAIANWLPILLIGALAIAFEWVSIQLPSLVPKPVAAGIGGVLLICFLAWSLAAIYTLSAVAFGTSAHRNAA